MSVTLQRRRRHQWFHRPAGLFVLAVLMLAFASSGVSSMEAHAHAHGHAPHSVHDPAHDHEAPADIHASDTPTEDEAMLHVHCMTLVATAIAPMTSFAPAELISLLTITPSAHIAPSNRPSEHFRPPIA